MNWQTLVAACLVIVTACTTSNPTQPEPNTPDTHKLVASGAVGTLTVNLYADTSLTAGYNPVFVRATLDGKPIEGYVTIGTTMDMGTMTHSCPIVQPNQTPDSAGFFHGAIVFTMPGTSNEWTVHVNVINPTTGTTTTVSVGVDVSGSSLVKTVKSGSVKTIIAMLPQSWKVGKNDIEFAIFRGTDPMYPALDSATVTMVPSMPSMGHGSYGNINPVQQENKRYRGVVNYSMTGDWKIDLSIATTDDVPVVASFNVTVP